MKHLSALSPLLLLALSCAGRTAPEQRADGAPAAPNTLSAAEAKEGWKLLFDGKSTDCWRGYQKDSMPDGWQIEDGALTRVGPAGDIVTKDEYGDFVLGLEWKIAPGGNSGIMFRVSEDRGATYETGPEMQVLDNAGHHDGLDPKTSAGSDYALYAPTEDVTRPAGEWNVVLLEVRGDHVVHWLNGKKIVDYRLWTPEWKALVAASKFGAMPGYGLNEKGHIALQDHGDRVAYRNIKILPLDDAGKPGVPKGS